MIRKILSSLIAALLLTGAVSAPQLAGAASATNTKVSSFDTVAGFGTILKADISLGAKATQWNLITPSGFSIQIAMSGGTDIRTDVSPKFTEEAGIYTAYLLDNRGKKLGQTSFEVFPDEVSPSLSELHTDASASADGIDYIGITVVLLDRFENPIQDHLIKVRSSRSADTVSAIDESPFTDERGMAHFTVQSTRAGSAAITAYDATEGLFLDQEASIQFKSASSRMGRTSVLQSLEQTREASIGGERSERMRFLQSGTSTNPIYEFEFEDLEDDMTLNDFGSFTLVAVDVNGDPVTDYSGEVTFSSPTDANISVPGDYQFDEDDLGRHTFELGLNFRTAGVQKLRAEDTTEPEVFGEAEVFVAERRGTAGDSDVVMVKPTAGTVTENKITVSGTAAAGESVNIYDNAQLIGIAVADDNGDFTFLTPELQDGSHEFYVESEGIESNSAKVTIRADQAQIEDIQLSADEVAPGGEVEIALFTESDMERVEVIFGDTVTELEPDTEVQGAYIGKLTAPAAEGRFPFDVQMVDTYGNPASFVEAGFITVNPALTPPNLGDGGVTFVVPSRVTELSAAPGDGRITLTWTPAADPKGIKYYRVYFGIDRASLDHKVDTQSSATTWYVPNLQNGVEYFFAVAGVNNDGFEADQLSAVVSSIPSGVGGPSLSDSDRLNEMPDRLSDDGPAGVAALIALSYLAGAALRRRALQGGPSA